MTECDERRNPPVPPLLRELDISLHGWNYEEFLNVHNRTEVLDILRALLGWIILDLQPGVHHSVAGRSGACSSAINGPSA